MDEIPQPSSIDMIKNMIIENYLIINTKVACLTAELDDKTSKDTPEKLTDLKIRIVELTRLAAFNSNFYENVQGDFERYVNCDILVKPKKPTKGSHKKESILSARIRTTLYMWKVISNELRTSSIIVID
jgi:hypothetical protein